MYTNNHFSLYHFCCLYRIIHTHGEIITNGGRVVCVTALGDDILDAQTKALAVCGAISFDGMQYRRDIGWRAIQSCAK